jgi:hypothetical protein
MDPERTIEYVRDDHIAISHALRRSVIAPFSLRVFAQKLP